MSSYHDSFSYNNKNSFTDMNLIISSFEPDDGFTESFLSMDPIYEENFDGTRDFSYGAKYNSKAKINITVIKKDQSDFLLKEFRECAKWLTGARIDSWLDLYMGPSQDSEGNPLSDNIVYSFLGKVTDLQPYKIDGRTIGFQIVFSSVTPWAFSAKQTNICSFGQALGISEDEKDILYAHSYINSTLHINDNGVLCTGRGDNNYFIYTNENDEILKGIVQIPNTINVTINNQTDDLYTYINLDTKFINTDCTSLNIENVTLDEITEMTHMDVNEIVMLSSEQFITSSIPNKIFGDKFNFIWPRIAPGENVFKVWGGGSAQVEFTYRYPMKVADGVIDVGTSDICRSFNN